MRGFCNCKSILLVGCLVLLAATIDQQLAEASRFRSLVSKLTEDAKKDSEKGIEGTKWAVLIAGSNGFYNYRHQADVCHAYQILKAGGFKDENIVVFMYDDIANDGANPRKGIIINSPNGTDVYKGVPKDYTGDDVTQENIFAAILGNASAIEGGSRKVVASGPNDHIFIFYSDHGGSGLIGLPGGGVIYANDLVDMLIKKHNSGTYKNLVFYLEACESGSVFDGLLPANMNIFATTAASQNESSFATYCPGDHKNPAPGEFDVCLGDLYSVTWMEDAEQEDRIKETLHDQYELVKEVAHESEYQTTVMEFGTIGLSGDFLAEFMGAQAKNKRLTANSSVGDHENSKSNKAPQANKKIKQRDADLVHFWHKFIRAQEGSKKRLKAQKELIDILSHRLHVDTSIETIGETLFAQENGHHIDMMNAVRPAGQVLVDDWDCLKAMVRTFEEHCGALAEYGLRHTRSMANMCNAGFNEKHMAEVASKTCTTIPDNRWSQLKRK